jgi:hypothetical protein
MQEEIALRAKATLATVPIFPGQQQVLKEVEGRYDRGNTALCPSCSQPRCPDGRQHTESEMLNKIEIPFSIL